MNDQRITSVCFFKRVLTTEIDELEIRLINHNLRLVSTLPTANRLPTADFSTTKPALYHIVPDTPVALIRKRKKGALGCF